MKNFPCPFVGQMTQFIQNMCRNVVYRQGNFNEYFLILKLAREKQLSSKHYEILK